MLSNSIAQLFDSVSAALRALLPQRCALCGASSGDALLCAACIDAMPRIATPCPTCALPADAPGVACAACQARPPPYAAACAAWRYAFPADRLVQALKYHGRLALAEPLAAAVVAALRDAGGPRPDLVAALPLSRARQRERGFNQAQELARRIAPALGCTLVTALDRVRDTPPQATLAWTARAGNVRGAFAARACVAGASVAVVDDVMTTGATLAEAARTLRRAGATRVEAWVVARTPPPDTPRWARADCAVGAGSPARGP